MVYQEMCYYIEEFVIRVFHCTVVELLKNVSILLSSILELANLSQIEI